MKNVFKVIVPIVVLALAATWFFFKNSEQAKQANLNLPKINQISSFELTDQDAKPFGFENLKGKVWAINFVFTRCQGPCPLMTSKMAELQREFPKGSGVEFVTVSMDAAYDKPAIMKAFGEKYEADFLSWHFLTGDPDKIIEIARTIFKVPADKDPEMHTTRVVLVDHEGFIRGYYDSLDPNSLSSLKEGLHFLKKRS